MLFRGVANIERLNEGAGQPVLRERLSAAPSRRWLEPKLAKPQACCLLLVAAAHEGESRMATTCSDLKSAVRCVHCDAEPSDAA